MASLPKNKKQSLFRVAVVHFKASSVIKLINKQTAMEHEMITVFKVYESAKSANPYSKLLKIGLGVYSKKAIDIIQRVLASPGNIEKAAVHFLSSCWLTANVSYKETDRIPHPCYKMLWSFAEPDEFGEACLFTVSQIAFSFTNPNAFYINMLNEMFKLYLAVNVDDEVKELYEVMFNGKENEELLGQMLDPIKSAVMIYCFKKLQELSLDKHMTGQEYSDRRNEVVSKILETWA